MYGNRLWLSANVVDFSTRGRLQLLECQDSCQPSSLIVTDTVCLISTGGELTKETAGPYSFVVIALMWTCVDGNFGAADDKQVSSLRL